MALPFSLASERIEEARRSLAEAANQGIDQIEIHEILGEGAVRGGLACFPLLELPSEL